MGLGPIKNGKPQPITAYVGSWAWKLEQERKAKQGTKT